MRNRILGPCILLGLMHLSLVMATSLVPMNLADLAHKSRHVFEGKCIKVEVTVVKSSGGKTDIPVVRYTFEVLDGIKGVVGETRTVTQLGRFTDGRDFFIKPEWVQLPKYEVGHTYLLFLTGASSTGLSSPMGMPQGVFDIHEGLARNKAGNDHILQGMASALEKTAYKALVQPAVGVKRSRASGMEVSQLKSLVRDLLSGKVTAPGRQEVAR